MRKLDAQAPPLPIDPTTFGSLLGLHSHLSHDNHSNGFIWLAINSISNTLTDDDFPSNSIPYPNIGNNFYLVLEMLYFKNLLWFIVCIAAAINEGQTG